MSSKLALKSQVFEPDYNFYTYYLFGNGHNDSEFE